MDSDDDDEAEGALFLVAAATIVTSAMLVVVEGSKRRRVIPRIQDLWLRRVPLMNDKDFQDHFRLPRPLFLWLVDELEQNEEFGVARSRAGLAHGLDFFLALTLYRLGHGCTLSVLESTFDIGQSTADKATWMIIPQTVIIIPQTVHTHVSSETTHLEILLRASETTLKRQESAHAGEICSGRVDLLVNVVRALC